MDKLRTTFGCTLLALLVAATGCVRSETRVADGTPAARGTGSIAGAIAWPGAGAPPAFRVCAIGSGGPGAAAHACVRTRVGDRRYRIDGLAADSYVVVAEQRDGDPRYRIAGHVRPVQCIRAPCNDMPREIALADGARVDDADLNGFYDKREDFDPLPAE